MVDWNRREFKAYPQDFQGILNNVTIYRCGNRQKRVMISNGIPDHDIESLTSNREPCEVNWAVEVRSTNLYLQLNLNKEYKNIQHLIMF